MFEEFKGRTVLVMGGTSGIGEAAVTAFATLGANVVFSGLEPDLGEALQQRIHTLGQGRALFIQTDVRHDAQVQRAIERAVAEFGRIHYAMNNAGYEGPYAPVQEIAEAEFDRVLAVNLKGVWLGMKYQIRHMLEAGSGAIVNTASSAGVVSIPNIGVYSASKHAIIGLSKAAAVEQAGAGIRINVIAPGPVRTGLLSRMVAGQVDLEVIAKSVPLGRISEPAEIAACAVWLCSDAASYVTGHTLLADGGITVA